MPLTSDYRGTTALRAPFPWFGGKSRVASIVWPRFGNVRNYVEPFAGSLAVLLARPHPPRVETVNDLNCHLANFWRALQHDPEAVAHWADQPINEADLHARHRWLVGRGRRLAMRVSRDPHYFNAKVAGWWVWGQSAWIGGGWCESVATAHQVKRPHLSSSPCVHAARARANGLAPYLGALAARLRDVRVCCGDWTRVLTPSVTTLNGSMTGVFLDPPYAHALRDDGCYAEDHDISADVRAWALAHGDDPQMRIALCGYEREHAMPASWACVPWKATGGYARTERGRANRERERIWFSPHCLPAEAPLFEGVSA